MNGEIAERYERFRGIVGVPQEAEWLNPPVSDAEVAGTEGQLGFELPPDLVELLSVHNGVDLFDHHQWIGCLEKHDSKGLAAATLWFHDLMSGQLTASGALDLVPGPRTLQVAVESHVAILYDPDGQPARMLYMDTEAQPSIVPLARDLATLIDGYIALAGAGYITLGPDGPARNGPHEGAQDVLVARGVADPMTFGIASWLLWPGSENFTIE